MEPCFAEAEVLLIHAFKIRAITHEINTQRKRKRFAPNYSRQQLYGLSSWVIFQQKQNCSFKVNPLINSEFKKLFELINFYWGRLKGGPLRLPFSPP